MAYEDFSTSSAARHAQEIARDAAVAQHRYNQRGTMRPKNDDPDASVREHGDVVEMTYDELAGAWVEQRKLPKP